jgi:hypothetical protein
MAGANREPHVGMIVIYMSHGSPVDPVTGEQKYASAKRAALITTTDDYRPQANGLLGLAVLNPTGLFFDEHVPYGEDHGGGTWDFVESHYGSVV